MTNIHFISYGDDIYKRSKQRIFMQAALTRWFDTIKVYGPDDLTEEFKLEFDDILKDNTLNTFYWIAKSHLIRRKFDEIKDGDILVYLDADGYIFNHSGKQRFNEYIDLVKNSEEGCLCFQKQCKDGSGLFIEKEHTIKEIFKYFGVEENGKEANDEQILNDIRILKKCPKAIEMIDKELQVLRDDRLLFTDYYSDKGQQNEWFKDNQHDQSVSSLIKKLNIKEPSLFIKDETIFHDMGTPEALKQPFWSTKTK